MQGCVTTQGYARNKNKTVLKYKEREIYVNQKKKIAKKYVNMKIKEICNTTPLLSLKSLTLSRATREMTISRTATGAGVELGTPNE